MSPFDDENESDNEAIDPLRNWVLQVVQRPETFEEHVGKAAAELCLYEANEFDLVYSTFRLALKCYCKSKGQSMDIQNLKSSACNNFATISAWLNCQPTPPLKLENLGVGYAILREWDKAATLLGSKRESGLPAGLWTEYLLIALFNAGDFKTFIKTLNEPETSKSLSGRQVGWSQYLLGIAYRAVGDTKNAIKSLENALEDPESPKFYQCSYLILRLGQLYSTIGNNKGGIKLYERALDLYPDLWWARQLLSIANKNSVNTEGAVIVTTGGSTEIRIDASVGPGRMVATDEHGITSQKLPSG